ncbi:cadherin-11 precursor, partial [Silurus asotus]
HVDFETKRSYTLKVEATNPHVDPRFISWGPYKDTTVVKISVEDADEPPNFMASVYSFEVEENAPGGTVVGRVHAKDTDMANSPIRYLIPRYTDLEEFFSINPEDGIIKTTRPLDRETQAWHNISVSATEIGNASALSFQGLLITEQACFSHSFPRHTGQTFPLPSFRVVSTAPSL